MHSIDSVQKLKIFMGAVRKALKERGSDAPVPRADQVQISAGRDEYDAPTITWSMKLEETSLKIESWLQELDEWTIGEFADALDGIWRQRDELVQNLADMRVAARDAFQAAARAGLRVRVKDVRLEKCRLGISYEGRIEVEFEALDELLRPANQLLFLQNEDDLAEDMESVTSQQKPRAILRAELDRAGGGILIDDVTVRACEAFGISILDAIASMRMDEGYVSPSRLRHTENEFLCAHVEDYVVRCTAHLPGEPEWTADRMKLTEEVAGTLRKGQPIGAFLQHTLIDPASRIMRVQGAEAHLETPLWLFEGSTGRLTPWTGSRLAA